MSDTEADRSREARQDPDGDRHPAGAPPPSGPCGDAPSSPAGGEGADGGPSVPAGSLTRRQFAAGAGAALVLPVAERLAPWRGRDVRTPAAPADAAHAPRRAARPGAPPTERGRGQESEEEPPGTEALVDHVRARWGDRLSEDELAQVRSSVAGQLRAGASISEVPLANGDGPATVFRAYRGEGR